MATEMANGRPLFAGTSDTDQLDRIFRHLGTPTGDDYPTITELPDYKPDFPNYDKPGDYSGLSPALDAHGIDLLVEMLQFDPAKRVSAADAMNHPYFANLSPAIKQMGEHK